MKRIQGNNTLKPCPFCGSKDLYIISKNNASGTVSGSKNKVTCVKCNTCHTFGPRVYVKGIVDLSKEEEAISLWNKQIRKESKDIYKIKNIFNDFLNLLKYRKKTVSKDIETVINTVTKKYTDKQLELFQELEVGDVVYALMPMNKNALKKIPGGHQERPYIVVSKTENKIIGYQCSSKDVKYGLSYQSYPFSQSVYETGKDSYIHLNNIYYIPIQNLRFKYKTLYLNTLLKLNKRITISNYHGNNLPMFSSSIYPPETGDILLLDYQYYYVDKVYMNNIYVYRVYNNITNKRVCDYCYVRNNKHEYYISYYEKEIIDIDDKYIYVDILSKDKISCFNEGKKDYKQLNKVKKQNYIQKYPLGKLFYIGMDDYLYLYHKNKKLYVLEKQDNRFILNPKAYDVKYEGYFKDNGVLNKENYIKIIKSVIERNNDHDGILADIIDKTDCSACDKN